MCVIYRDLYIKTHPFRAYEKYCASMYLQVSCKSVQVFSFELFTICEQGYASLCKSMQAHANLCNSLLIYQISITQPLKSKSLFSFVFSMNTIVYTLKTHTKK
jgi:hypothetical protein